jgi:hypothetical protein
MKSVAAAPFFWLGREEEKALFSVSPSVRESLCHHVIGAVGGVECFFF